MFEIGTNVEAHAHQSVKNRMLRFVPSNVFRNASAMAASFLTLMAIVSPLASVVYISTMSRVQDQCIT